MKKENNYFFPEASFLPVEVMAGMRDSLGVKMISQLEKGLVFADEPMVADKVRFAYRVLIDPNLLEVIPRSGDNYYFRFSVDVGEKTYYLKFTLDEQMKPEVGNQLNRILIQLNEAIEELSKATENDDHNSLIFIGKLLLLPRDRQVRIKSADVTLFKILCQALNSPVEERNPSLRTIEREEGRIRIFPTRLSSSGIYWWETAVLKPNSMIRLRYDLAVLNSQSQREFFLRP